MNRYEILNFDKLNALPRVDLDDDDLIYPWGGDRPGLISPIIPPFHPIRFMVYISNDKTTSAVPMIFGSDKHYHKVDLSDFSFIKVPEIDHPEVAEWINNLRQEYQGWYIHPDFGPFNTERLNSEMRLYDASGEGQDKQDYLESLRTFALASQERKDDFDQYTTLNNAVYVTEVRRWYPDFLRE